jgi:hypothetical protein
MLLAILGWLMVNTRPVARIQKLRQITPVAKSQASSRVGIGLPNDVTNGLFTMSCALS